MVLLRLFAALLIAAVVALPAAAQSPIDHNSPATTPHLQIPPLSRGSSSLFPEAQKATPTAFILARKRPAPDVSAINNASCYAIRNYGFTPHDLESSSPRPSSFSVCSRTADHAFKDAVALPTK